MSSVPLHCGESQRVSQLEFYRQRPTNVRIRLQAQVEAAFSQLLVVTQHWNSNRHVITSSVTFWFPGSLIQTTTELHAVDSLARGLYLESF